MSTSAPSAGESTSPADDSSADSGSARVRMRAPGASVEHAVRRNGAEPEQVALSGRAAFAPRASAFAHRDRVLIAAHEVMPALGLYPGRVRVTVEPPGGSVPRGHARGAHAVVLAPLGDADGALAVLVHELAHVRQHENRNLRGAPAPDITRAEAEAAGLAAAARAGRPLWQPRAVLPDGHRARNSDADGIAGDWKQLTGWVGSDPDVGALESELEALVAENHLGDIETIRARMQDGWLDLESERIEASLRVLAMMPFVSARALVRALPPAIKLRLGRLDASHHENFPGAAVAVLSALTAEELRRLAQGFRPDGRYHRGVVQALAGVQPERLGADARRALLETLRKVGYADLLALVRSQRRSEFRALLHEVPDTSDTKELKDAIRAEKALRATRSSFSADPARESADGDAAAGRLASVVGRAAALLRDPDPDQARDALDVLMPFCTPRLDSADEHEGAVTRERLVAVATTAPPSAAASNAPPVPRAELASVVARLDARGDIDRMLDRLGETHRFSAHFGWALRCVLAARTPTPNLMRATSLLSYGLLDWRIWDAEARFAYLLVRSCPIAAQDAWRRQDSGKWMQRLMDNLPDEVVRSGEYTGVGSEYDVGGPLNVSSRMLQDHAESLIEEWNHRDRETDRGRAAVTLLLRLVGRNYWGRAAPWAKGPDGAPAQLDLALRTAIVRRLDMRGLIGEIVDELPPYELASTERRGYVLELFQLRDPGRLWAEAVGRERGWFGDSRQAWIGMLAVLALPLGEQLRFKAERKDTWNELWATLTPEMRREMPSQLAAGRDSGLPTRDALRAAIEDARLWTEEKAIELRGLANLVVAADDHAWLFGLSRRMRVDEVSARVPRGALAAFVADFRLYDPRVGRSEFVARLPEVSERPRWLGSLAMAGRGLLGVVVPYVFSEGFEFIGKTMRAHAVPLDDIQGALGGDLFGATLKRGPVANTVDVDVTFEAGFVTLVRIPQLEFSSINIVLPGATYRTGAARLQDLRVTAGFGDRRYRDPLFVTALIEALDIQDLVIISPPAALAAAAVAARRLSFAAAQDATWNAHAKQTMALPSGIAAFPVPVIGPLFQVIKNIVDLTGGVPGDLTPLGIATTFLPAPPGIGGMLFGKAQGYVFDKADPGPRLAASIWGRVAEGRWGPPRSPTERATDAIGMLRAFDVGLESFWIDGAALGATTRLRSLAVSDLQIGMGGGLRASLATTAMTLRHTIEMLQTARERLQPDSAERAELDRRIEVLANRIATLDAPSSPRRRELTARAGAGERLTPQERLELANTTDNEADEKRLTELESKHRRDPGSFTAKDRIELRALTGRLRATFGVSAHVGSILIGPVSGDVEFAGIQVRDIDADVRLPSALARRLGALETFTEEYLDDESLITRFRAGGEPMPSPERLAATTSLNLSVNSARLLRPDPSRGALVIRADAKSLPTAAEVAELLAAMPRTPATVKLRGRLTAAHAALIGIEQRRSAAESPTHPLRGTAQQAVRELTDDARRLLGIEIGDIRIGPVMSRYDPDTQTFHTNLPFATTDVAAPGVVIDSISGALTAELQLRGTTTSGMPRPAATAALSDFSAKGIQLASGSVGSTSFGSLSGQVNRTPDGFRISDLRLKDLALDRIAFGGVRADRVTLGVVTMDVEVVESTAGGETRILVHTLHIDELSGEGITVDRSGPDGRAHLELRRGSLHDITLRDAVLIHAAGGAWDVLSVNGGVGSVDARYEVALATLTSGTSGDERITIEGRIHSDPRGNEPTISVGYVKDADGHRRYTLDFRRLIASRTRYRSPRRSFTISTATLKTATVKGVDQALTIEAGVTGIRVGAISLAIAGGRLHGPGPATIETVAVNATFDMATGAYSVSALDLLDITAVGLAFDRPPLHIELGGLPTPAVPPLRVRRVHLELEKGSFRVEDLEGSIRAKLSTALGVEGHLKLAAAQLELQQGDRMVALVHGLGASGKLFGDQHGAFDVQRLDGRIGLSPDAITLGGDGPDGSLSLERLALASLDLSLTVGGKPVRIRSGGAPGGGDVVVTAVAMRVRVDLWRPGEMPAGSAPFRRATVERFRVDELRVPNLRVDLPTEGLSLVTDRAGAPITVHGLTIGPSSAGGTEAGFIYDAVQGRMTGAAAITDFAAPLEVYVRRQLLGIYSASTSTASVDWLGSGGMRVNVTDPLLAVRRLALSPDSRFSLRGIGADHFTYAEGKATIAGSHVEGAEYELLGVGGRRIAWVKVEKATGGDIAVDMTLAAGSSTRVVVPRLSIDAAQFDLDLLALAPPAVRPDPSIVPPAVQRTAAEAEEQRKQQEALRPLFDALSGEISLVLFTGADILSWADVQVGTDARPLRIPITHGRLDMSRLESNIRSAVTVQYDHETRVKIFHEYRARGLVPAALTQLVEAEPDWVDDLVEGGIEGIIETVGRDPMFRIDGNRLQLGVYLVSNPMLTSLGPAFRSNLIHNQFTTIMEWDISRELSRQPGHNSTARAFAFSLEGLPLWSAVFDRVTKPDPPGDVGVKSRILAAIASDRTALRRLDAQLSARSNTPIPISVQSRAFTGTLLLSPDAILDLKLRGGVPAVVDPSVRSRTPAPSEQIAVGLRSAAVDRVDVAIHSESGRQTGSLQTGRIAVSGVRDVFVQFSTEHAFTPARLSGVITSATAQDVTITVNSPAMPGSEKPTP